MNPKFSGFVSRLRKRKHQPAVAHQNLTSTMTSLQEQQPVALRESSQSTTTDPFMLELPASPIGDPQYIGKPLEVDRDEWLGQHYLNCIIAQMLLRNSSTSEEVSLFNVCLLASHTNVSVRLNSYARIVLPMAWQDSPTTNATSSSASKIYVHSTKTPLEQQPDQSPTNELFLLGLEP